LLKLHTQPEDRPLKKTERRMMPSSAMRTFSDPDEYAAAICATNTEFTVTERGRFAGKIIRIHLHRLWIQWASDNLPHISHLGTIGGRAVVSFRTKSGPSLFTAGLEMQPTNIVRHSEGQSYHRRSSGLAVYGSMSLPVAAMVSFGVVADADLTPPKDPQIHTPPASDVAKLQRLYAAAVRLAENAPEIIANPDAARGLEQALIEAIVGCLSHRDGGKSSLAQGQHAIVMRRFHDVVEEHPGDPLYIPEICKAIGVSESTLRMCCQEHLGMSPKRYLLLRGMALTRRVLRQAEPDATSVTATATRYGFWELGRFAVEYQSLFGEPPSATLHRPPN
jgi:AraC-like DNA-binding protein